MRDTYALVTQANSYRRLSVYPQLKTDGETYRSETLDVLPMEDESVRYAVQRLCHL